MSIYLLLQALLWGVGTLLVLVFSFTKPKASKPFDATTHPPIEWVKTAAWAVVGAGMTAWPIALLIK